eukprot:TRINITY_DN10029_c1_g3_i3.p1 TRINITY_DN10029_c1_g3~~TRINITY_DN10029_c1_g3_i3.p1  ORF type:complete len:147 (-),score=30.64 TRINITY_DN10029_c1_g3_i3:269-709(-)
MCLNEGVTAIAQALQFNTTLTCLSLERTSIDIDGIKSISEVLESNSTLQNLNISRNIIRGGINSLSQSLQTNFTLTSLHLLGTQIGDDDCSAIAQLLQFNSTLTYLNLSKTVSALGIQYISQALYSNTTLKILDISFSLVGNEGIT